MTNVKDNLAKIDGLRKSRRDFMEALFETILALPSKVNFRNMSRFGPYCEKTYARHFAQPFDFAQLNRTMIEPHLGDEVIAAIDTSFIAKSGKRTYGLDRFFDTRIRKSRKGLEISVIALVDQRCAYTLDALQTPAFPKASKRTPKSQRRMQHYIDQYRRAQLPEKVRHIAADGAYARSAFIKAVRASGRHLTTRLRSDANLRYLYTGPQPGPRGRPRRYDGKVDLTDVSGMDFLEEIEPGIELYTALVNSPHMKQDFRIAYVLDKRDPDDVKYIVLASTDLSLSAKDILRYYKQRFQIEFIFRDAKQHTGLCNCQAREKNKLDFHFNAALSALNIARLKWAQKEHNNVFSMASIKRISFNELFLDHIFLQLGFDPELQKKNPAFERLRSFGTIAA